MPAVGALVAMAADCGCATPPDSQQHFDMHRMDPLAVSCDDSCLSWTPRPS
jgi:hypothetical protein